MFPKFVNIKGQKYKVKFTKINPNLMGLCEKEQKLIFLNSTNLKSVDEMLITYCHELCHAFIHEYNLDTVVSYDIEELICMMSEDLARNVANFVKANKKAFEKWEK